MAVWRRWLVRRTGYPSPNYGMLHDVLSRFPQPLFSEHKDTPSLPFCLSRAYEFLALVDSAWSLLSTAR